MKLSVKGCEGEVVSEGGGGHGDDSASTWDHTLHAPILFVNLGCGVGVKVQGQEG